MQQNVDLKNKSSFKIGGLAQYFFELKNETDFLEALSFAREKNLTPYIFGGLSNVLLPDNDLPLVFLLSASQKYPLDPATGVLEVWAGEKTAALAWSTLRLGYSGLHDFTSLPGSIGGAIWNNSHYQSSLISDTLLSVRYFDWQQNKIINQKRNDLDFAYDKSWFQTHSSFILSATFQLEHTSDFQVLIDSSLRNALERKKTQPLGLPSAGCFWQNPNNNEHLRQLFPQFAHSEKISAGFLIDKAGLKGSTCGQAQISKQHAAFIINLGSASSSEVRALADLVINSVRNQFQIELRPEVIII